MSDRSACCFRTFYIWTFAVIYDFWGVALISQFPIKGAVEVHFMGYMASLRLFHQCQCIDDIVIM